MANGYVGAAAEPVWPQITRGLLLHTALNSGHFECPPFLTMSIGQDQHSWGVFVEVGERTPAPQKQAVELAVRSRWRKRLETLEDVSLVAQGALRRLAEERGWRIL